MPPLFSVIRVSLSSPEASVLQEICFGVSAFFL